MPRLGVVHERAVARCGHILFRICLLPFCLEFLRTLTIGTRMATLPRMSGSPEQEILSQYRTGSGTASDASNDDEDPYIYQNDMTSLYEEPKSVNAAVLQDRAVQIRDILSTFSRNNFPSEHIQPNLFNRIALLDEPKAIEDCIGNDIVSTNFSLAVNNWAQYSILRHILPEEVCAQHFNQKLRRRINAQIEAYDALDAAARSVNPPDRDHIRAQVGIIAAELNRITEIIQDDRAHRRQGEVKTATHLVYMMQEVCRRNYRPGGRSHGRHGFSGNRNSNLFQILFGNMPNCESRFGLDALKAFSKDAIMGQRAELNLLRELLVDNSTSQGYIKQFDEITGISEDALERLI
jgi:hypothetical protein